MSQQAKPYAAAAPLPEDNVSPSTPVAVNDSAPDGVVLHVLADKNKKERSSLVSRNVTIDQHRTSVRLEPDMWNALRDICRREHITIHDIATIVSMRKAVNTSLTAGIRVFVMAYFRDAATEEGHSRAGHGPGGPFMTGLVQKKGPEPVSANQNQGLSRTHREFYRSHRLRVR
ncbi:MAG: ribbon-helix-helix domain-containing protein [Alphaproteobacteria bacterium]|nr:ribbon-helix-helix domain-containing protein [Alphaproteobacteria bacterium]